MSCVVRGSDSPAWLGSCIRCFFLCPQPTHTFLVFALVPSISEHLSISPQSSLLWKVKKELILGRRLLLASCRGSCSSLKSEMPEGIHIRRERWKALNNEEKGQEEVGCPEKSSHSGVGTWSYWNNSFHLYLTQIPTVPLSLVFFAQIWWICGKQKLLKEPKNSKGFSGAFLSQWNVSFYFRVDVGIFSLF